MTSPASGHWPAGNARGARDSRRARPLLFGPLVVGIVLLLPGALASGAGPPTGPAAPEPARAVNLTSPLLPSGATPAGLQHRLWTLPLSSIPNAMTASASGAAWLAFAPWDNSFFVATPPSSLDVIAMNGSRSGTLTNVVPVGLDPFGVATDSANREVFVTDSGGRNITVVSTSTMKSVASVRVQSDPLGIAFDATDGAIFVADHGSDNVTEIAVASLSAIATIPVGRGPLGVAWDPATDRVFVTDQSSRAVSAIAGATGSVVATIPVGSRPNGIAVDNATDNVYVANQGSFNLSVFNASTGGFIATVPVLLGWTPLIQLEGVVYDSQRNLIWVAGGTIYAVVVNTTNEVVEDYVVQDPAGAAFDSKNGDVCMTNSANRTFACFISGLGGYGRYAPYLLTFHETGLPAGTFWRVELSDTTGASNGSSILFGVIDLLGGFNGLPYSYSYLVEKVPGYRASSRTGTASSSTGANLTVQIRFT